MQRRNDQRTQQRTILGLQHFRRGTCLLAEKLRWLRPDGRHHSLPTPDSMTHGHECLDTIPAGGRPPHARGEWTGVDRLIFGLPSHSSRNRMTSKQKNGRASVMIIGRLSWWLAELQVQGVPVHYRGAGPLRYRARRRSADHFRMMTVLVYAIRDLEICILRKHCYFSPSVLILIVINSRLKPIVRLQTNIGADPLPTPPKLTMFVS